MRHPESAPTLSRQRGTGRGRGASCLGTQFKVRVQILAVAPLFFVLLLPAFAPGFAAQVTEDPLEREMLSIATELRCAVCQNQPISESDADLARDMRQVIREQLAAGKSREEIIDFFVARYGEYVLLKPPYRGPGLLVWLGPLVLIGIIGVSGFVYLRRRLQSPMPPAPPLSEEDAARVREARRRTSL